MDGVISARMAVLSKLDNRFERGCGALELLLLVEMLIVMTCLEGRLTLPSKAEFSSNIIPSHSTLNNNLK